MIRRFTDSVKTRTACAGLVLAVSASFSVNAQVVLTEAAESVGLIATHGTQLDNPDFTGQVIGGLGIGDFNRDGWSDVFWVGGGAADPDKLFINNGDGTFSEQSEDWLVSKVHSGSGVAVADFNNDGWHDIFVTSFGPPEDPEGQPGFNILYRNTGDGTFTDVAVSAGVNDSEQPTAPTFSSCWGDYDVDGDLDLFVGFWDRNAENAIGNKLYQNNGDETFTDVTDAATGTSLHGCHSLAPSFADIDGDLYPELIVIADFLSSRYLINNRDGTFTDFTGPSGTGLDENGMGQFVADVNNDGLFDIYATSIYGPNLNKFGNKLYMGVEPHIFIERGQAAGVDEGNWGWATIAIDLDHDTWIDILEVNGWSGNQGLDEPGRLFYNLGTHQGNFTDQTASSGYGKPLQGRSLAYLDADRDGDRDFLVGTNGADVFTEDKTLQYFRNDQAGKGNWIQLEFDTSDNPLLPPDGYHTFVRVTIGEKEYISQMYGSPSFLATSEMSIHFGLADAKSIDELYIRWARGQETILTDVAVNQHLMLIGPSLADLDADGAVGTSDLLLLLGAWGPVDTPQQLKADLNNDGHVNATDLITLLGNWR